MKKIIVAEGVKPLLMTRGNSFIVRSGIAVFTAATNDEALKMHIEEQADLIITALSQPGLDPEGLFAIIRQSKELRKVSTILLYRDSAEERKRAARCGANVIMALPAEPGALAAKAQQLLDVAPRRSYRVILNVTVEGTCGNRPLLCTSENLSATGMLIRTEDKLAEGDRVSCSFYLPDGTKVAARGEIVRAVQHDGEAKSRYYGVHFTEMAAHIKAAVQAFIDKEVRRESPETSGPQPFLVA